jgi:hypothetical protein
LTINFVISSLTVSTFKPVCKTMLDINRAFTVARRTACDNSMRVNVAVCGVLLSTVQEEVLDLNMYISLLLTPKVSPNVSW